MVEIDTTRITKRSFRGQEFFFYNTLSIPSIIDEIFSDNYKVFESGLTFSPGDVILDLGANEGVFSIMMAKLFPFTRVISLEPVPRTFAQFVRNVGLNGCMNIEPFCLGVGDSIKSIYLNVSKDYSGGSTSLCTFNPDHHTKDAAEIVTIDSLFTKFNLSRIRLLKIDIEGMEYEALYASTLIPSIDFITAELHMNNKLDFKGRRMDGLVTWLRNRTKVIHVEVCKMAE